MERGGTLMPNGEPPPGGGGDSLGESAKAARADLGRVIRGLGPEVDQQGGLPGEVDPTEAELAQRALADLKGVKPGGRQGGLFRRAAGAVGNLGQAIGSSELRQAVGIGLRHWADNLNPRNIVDKNWLWRAGFGLGVIESLAFTALPLPLKGFAKAGLNLVIIQGTHIVLNLPRAREVARAQRQHPGTIDQEMTNIAEKYGKAHQRIKDCALGLSAGAMYLSLGSIVSEVGKEALGWNLQATLQDRFEPGKGPPPVAGGAAPAETPTGTPAPKIAGLAGGEPPKMPAPIRAPGPIVEATATPTPVAGPGGLPPTGPDIGQPPPVPAAAPPGPGLAEMPSAAAQAVKEQAIKAISNDPNYVLEKAAEVGKILPAMQDDIIREALTQSDLSPSDVSTDALEKARVAVQHALEGKANTFFDNNLNVNPSAGLDGVVEAGQKSFESWLSSDSAHAQLAEIAKQAMVDQAQVADAVAQNVSTALEAVPDLFTDQAIAHGTNVGSMLQDAGYQVTWTGADAEMLGAHIAANNDILTEMWHQMAANHNIPESPFPVGLAELNDLVAKAQTGDKEALRKLLAALRYIPAGQKFKILNKEGISAVLGALG